MIEITPSTLPQRLTVRMIVEEAMQRGWQALSHVQDSPQVRLVRPDGHNVDIFSSAPPTTSYVAAHMCNDKYITHSVLQDGGLSVLPTYRCSTDAEANAAVEALINAGKEYVVKPLAAGHGNGITVKLHSIDQLMPALRYAREYSSVVVIQAYQPQAVDLRVLCINYKVVATLERIPAQVIGDGKHTTHELIAIQNEQRGLQYTTDLSAIPVDRAIAFLGDAIHDIPAIDEVVQVLGMANIGMGGFGRDVTDEMPGWLIALAERAARELQLPVCGVDFLTAIAPSPDATSEMLEPSITELNACPSLFIHERPKLGHGRNVVAAYVDYLAGIQA